MGPEEGVPKSPEEVEVKAHQNEEDLNQGGVIQARVAGGAADAGKRMQNAARRFESIKKVSSKYVSPLMHYTPFTICYTCAGAQTTFCFVTGSWSLGLLNKWSGTALRWPSTLFAFGASDAFGDGDIYKLKLDGWI